MQLPEGSRIDGKVARLRRCLYHDLTAPYSSQSNGVVERENRTIMDLKNGGHALEQNKWYEFG